MQKDKMSDNLSVDVLEYLKNLLAMGVHLIDMRETDIVQSLKILVDFKNSSKEIKITGKKVLKMLGFKVISVFKWHYDLKVNDICGDMAEN